MKFPFKKSKKWKVVGRPFGYMYAFSTIIQQATRGKPTSMKGNISKVIEEKSSLSPSIFEEWPCKRDLFVMYLDRMLRKARGITTGMPAWRRQAIMRMR